MSDKQLQLNKMIRLYAANEGLTFKQAYLNFRLAFNSTYKVDITVKMEQFKKSKGLKNLSLPAYLKKVERLDHAIMVADKLLNYHANPLAK